MTFSIKGLGYALIGAEDLDAFRRFGSDVLGLMVAEQTDDRLLLRMDDRAYRIAVYREGARGVNTVGWDVGNAEGLVDVTKALQTAGYDVEVLGADVAEERKVRELIRFRDPDDIMDVEIYWGLYRTTSPFVSPQGAEFVTVSDTGRDMGFGHFLQLVTDQELLRRLYVDVLGFRVSDWIEAPGSDEVAWFTRVNERHHSLAFVTPPPGREKSVAHLMWEVRDVDQLGRIMSAAELSEFPVLSTLGKHTNDKMISFYVGGPGGVGIEFGTGGLQVDDATWEPSRYDDAHYWGHNKTGAPRPA